MDLSLLLKFEFDTGRLFATSKETGGELGLATSMDVVGDAETARGISESGGSVAWWGCGVDGTSRCGASSNCIDASMTTETIKGRRSSMESRIGGMEYDMII